MRHQTQKTQTYIDMPETFVFDNRIPVGDNTSESDPNHPKNIHRSALIIQNQANADTKYDIQPPPRIHEGFVAGRMHIPMLLLIASIIGIVVSLVFILRTHNIVVRMVSISVLLICIHYAVGVMEKRTV